jgi:hypothetical protein
MVTGYGCLDIVFDPQDEVGSFGQGAIIWQRASVCPTKLVAKILRQPDRD